MATSRMHAPPSRRQEAEHDAQRVAGGLGGFWTKINNDWIFNLSGLLAYNLLMSIFPILLVLLAVAGLLLGAASPATYHTLITHMGNALPGGSSIVSTISANLSKDAGLVLIIGIVTSIVGGSNLFVVLENCFGIVFRLRGRNLIHQKLMSIGMLLIYAVLVPLVFLASILPTAVIRAIPGLASSPIGSFLAYVAGDATGFVVAATLFGIIYVVVPNRPVMWREVWRGTLVAAALLVVYEIVFPIYESIFLKSSNYGSLAGFAVVILVFFYYMAFILLLGAEVNSWASGQRQTAGDLDAIIHEVQAHNTTRGAAGPTAGTHREDMQNHLGAAAMSSPERAVIHERDDHDTSLQPPKYAEAGQPGAGPAEAQPQTPQQAQRTQQAEQESKGGHGPKNPDAIGEQDDGAERPLTGPGTRR